MDRWTRIVPHEARGEINADGDLHFEFAIVEADGYRRPKVIGALWRRDEDVAKTDFRERKRCPVQIVVQLVHDINVLRGRCGRGVIFEFHFV